MATISTQPTNLIACAATNAAFTVAAIGTGTLSYLWEVSTDGGINFNQIVGATSATLNLTGVTTGMNNNQYRCVVTNTVSSTSCNIVSNAAILTVPNYTFIGGTLTATAGTSYTSSIVATGALSTFNYALSTGSLPSGITLTAAGLLSGTPTTTGTFIFGITAIDQTAPNCTTTASFTLIVSGTYYSNVTTTGVWNNATNWAFNTAGTATATTFPTANDIAIIQIGDIITIVGAISVNNLTITGTLDLATTTGHTINTLAGAGTLRLSALASSTAVLPTVTAGNNTFAGIVEFYGTPNYFLPTTANLAQFNTGGILPNLLFNGGASSIKIFQVPITVSGNTTVATGIVQLDFLTSLTVGGSFTMNPTTILRVGANNFPTSGTYDLQANSLVQYQGTTQIIKNVGAGGYANLALQNTSIKQLEATTLVKGNLTIQSGVTLDFGTTAQTLTLQGDLSASSGGIITMTGTGLTHVLDLQGANNGLSTLTASNNAIVRYSRTNAMLPINTTQNVFITTSAANPYPNIEFIGGAKTLNASVFVKGNWTNNVSAITTTNSTVTFNGTGANSQNILGNSTTFNNLTINTGAAGVGLGVKTFANGALNFTSGNIILLNGFDFELGTSASVTGAFDNTKMFVADGTTTSGKLIKNFVAGTISPFTFPIGTGSVYSPAVLSGIINTGGGIVSVRPIPVSTNIPTTSTANTNTLSRYWDIAGTATVSSGNWTFDYLDSEVRPTSGVTTSYVVAHSNGTLWDIQPNSQINTGTKKFTYNIASGANIGNLYSMGEVLSFTDFIVKNNFDTGAESLRDKINLANIVSGLNTITFSNTVFNTSQTISIASDLPIITESVVIGTSPTAFNVILQKTAASTATNGFNIQAPNTTILGLQILGFNNGIITSGTGIQGLVIDNTFIQGNYSTGAATIGLNLGGTAGTSVAQITNNTIVGHLGTSGAGVGINVQANNINISNSNFIGNDGNIALANGKGIVVGTAITGTNISNNNISGNTTGLELNNAATVTNNRIGTNSSALTAIPNGTGILVNAAGATVDNNTISGNTTGIALNNTATVTNNKIGTNSASATGLGNAIGILVNASATIGATGNGNTIAGNTTGIRIVANSPSTVQFNNIGVANLGNTTGIEIVPTVPTASQIQNNNMLNNGTAISLGANSSGANVLSNIIAGSTTSAIHVLGIGANIGTSNVADKNTLTNNLVAINLVGTGNNVINNDILTNTTAINIVSTSVDNTIANNTISNGATGMSIASSANRIGVSGLLAPVPSPNIITNNSIAGIVIAAPASGNSILFNQIYGNATTSTVSNNTVFAATSQLGLTKPIISSVAANVPVGQATVVVTVNLAGTYRLQFYRNRAANPQEAEAFEYLGEVASVNMVASTATPVVVSLAPMPATPEYITVIATNLADNSSSPISDAYSVSCTDIVSMVTSNVLTTCAGTTSTIIMQLGAFALAGDYDVDIDGNGTYEFVGITMTTAKTLIILGVQGNTTFNNSRVRHSSGCLSSLYLGGAITTVNLRLTVPQIANVRVVNPTRCDIQDGKLIIKLANPRMNQTYDVDINGVYGTEFNGLQVRADSTIVVENLNIGFRIAPSVAVWQNGLLCYGQAVPFTAILQRPTDIDTTKVTYVDPNWREISPNFGSFIILEKSQDSVLYDLVRLRDNTIIRKEVKGNGGTLVFATDTMSVSQDYAIYAKHIRSTCRIVTSPRLVVTVINGILGEELDILREVYTSTKGNAWTTKWNFALSYTTFIGVKVFAGRVTEIRLPNNNLDSVLTTKTLNLRKLKVLDISNNKLDFASVEPFVNRTFAFTYAIQANVDKDEEYTFYAGQSIKLKIKTGGTQNRYQWTKTPIGGNTQNLNATFLPEYDLNNLTLADAGIYSTVITNSVGTNLTLQRRNIRLRIVQRGNLDSMVLVQLNDDLGGGNWKNKWDRSKPVAEWYGVEMSGAKVLSINLANNNLVGKLPDVFVSTGILSDLIYLNLSGNQISGTIPKTLGNLKKLQYLDLSKNLLTGEVISELGTLSDLQTLWLSNNLFESVHADIGKLAKLQNFLLSNNQIKTLPNELSNLLALQKLGLANNLLANLPTGAEKWINLQLLDISGNKFATLANVFANMRNMTEFYAQNNLLRDIPVSFANLTALQTFVIHTNFLDFGDLEALRNLSVINSAGAIYEPQDKVDVAQDLTFNLSQAISLSVTTAGTANRYQWFKDGVAIGGATAATYNKNFPSLADGGVYTVEITNTLTSKLTLIRRDILVRVVCGNSNSIELGSQGTITYCEGEKINTLLTATIIDANLKANAYQWFINGSRLVGEDKATVNIIREGSYNVQITDQQGCIYQAAKPLLITVIAKPIVTIALQTNNGNQLVKATIGNVTTNVKTEWYVVPANSQIAQQMQVSGTATEVKPLIAGTYYVIVSDAKGCPAKSASLAINVVTGLAEDLFAQQLQIYPNPSNRYFTLKTDIAHEELTLKLINALGQSVEIVTDSFENNLRIDADELASGTYLLEISKKQANGKQITVYKKLIKQ